MRNLVALLLLLVAVLGYLFMFLPAQKPGSASSPVIEPQVAFTVAQFGKQLQKVSLLATAPHVREQIAFSYSPFVTPELLSVWEANPESAPGRLTSSPWPDRIEIQSVEPQTDGSYVVQGTVIEITSKEAEHGGIAGTYPVKIRLARHQQQWLIMQFERGAYSDIPGEVMVRGTLQCLPHRDTSGPQTTECAFGLKKDDTDTYYGLDMNLLQSKGPLMLAIGTHMSVAGILTPVEMLSSIQKYNIAGIISVTNILEPVQQ